MDKVNVATDERLDLTDALRLGSLPEASLIRLVRFLFGQTSSDLALFGDETDPAQPLIWEPVQFAAATLAALPIAAFPAVLQLELRKSGSRRSRIFGADGNEISGPAATSPISFNITTAPANGTYYIKARRKETAGQNESRFYWNRTTKQEFGQATSTELLDDWELKTFNAATDTSDAPVAAVSASGVYFTVASFTVAGGAVTAVSNLVERAFKRARTHSWASRTALAQDSFRTLKDIYDAVTTAIAEMRDGQLWFVDPATQAKFEANGGVKLKNGAIIRPGTNSVDIYPNGAAAPFSIDDGQILAYKSGGLVLEVQAGTAGRLDLKSPDSTRTIRIQTARANAAGNVPLEHRWPTAGVPAPNTYLDRYLTTASGGADREHARANAWTGHWESPHVVIDDDFLRPSVNIGDRSHATYVRSSVGSGAVDLLLNLEQAGGSTVWRPTYACSIVGVSYFLTLAPDVSSNITIKVKKNGVALFTAFSGDISEYDTKSYTRGQHQIGANDTIEVTYSTSSPFSPTAGQLLTVLLDVETSENRGLWTVAELVGDTGKLGGGATDEVSLITAPATTVGALRLRTPGSGGPPANNLIRMELNSQTAIPFASGAAYILKTRLRPSATSDIRFAFGLFSSATLNAMFNLYKAATPPADTRWRAAVNFDDTGAAESGTDTGIAASTANFVDAEIWIGPSSTVFLLDGSVVATLAALAPANFLYPRFRLLSSVPITRDVTIDYIRVYATRGAL